MRGTIGYKYHIQCIILGLPKSLVGHMSHVDTASAVVGPGFKLTSFEIVIKITASYARDSDEQILEFGLAFGLLT